MTHKTKLPLKKERSDIAEPGPQSWSLSSSTSQVLAIIDVYCHAYLEAVLMYISLMDKYEHFVSYLLDISSSEDSMSNLFAYLLMR